MSGNRYIVAVTEQFSKLTNAIPTAKTTATTVATFVLEHCVSSFDIPRKVWTGKGPQWSSKFVPAICTQLVVEMITTNRYHHKTNERVERSDRKIVCRLQHYVAEYREDQDGYALPITYAYSIEVHRAIELLYFSPILTQKSPESATICSSTITRSIHAN